MAWTTQNAKALRELVISANKQAAYGTELADAALTRRCLFDGAFPRIAQQHRSDKDKFGKGHAFPTTRILTDQTTEFAMGVDLDSFWAGWIPAFLMGAVSEGGGGGPTYTHTFTFMAPGDQPVTTIYSEDGDGIKRRFPDMTIVSAEFSGTGRGLVQAQFSMVGSGRKVDDDLASLPALPTIVEILASDLETKLGAPGAAAALDPDRILQWKVSLSNGVQPLRAPGSTVYSSKNRTGKQSATVSLVVAAGGTDDIETLFLAGTERELQLNINSGAAAQLKFKFPHIYFSAAPRGLDGDNIVYQVETDEDALLKSGADNLVEVVAINSQATYLTNPA